MAKTQQQQQQRLWFVKYTHKTECQQIVFQFTLPLNATEAEAFIHGRSFIRPDYSTQFQNAEATRICRTSDTVLYHEPC